MSKLTFEQRKLISAHLPPLISNIGALSRIFYERLFEKQPQLKPLFRHNMGVQLESFAQMMLSIFREFNYLDQHVHTLNRLGKRHVEYGVTPEHYPLVGEALFYALAKVLGQAWTPELESAWVALFELMTSLLTADNYTDNESGESAK